MMADKTQFASLSQAERDERIAGLNEAIAERNKQIGDRLIVGRGSLRVLCVA